jgi:para-nitrobenzyl esterase
VLPRRAIASVREGSAKGVAVMTGTTRDEWKLFTATAAKLRLMDTAKLRSLTAGLVGEDRADTVLAAYPDGSSFDKWNAVMTDHSFIMPAIRLAEAQGEHAPTYLYRFDWASPFLGGVIGACHAIEIGFMFGTYNEKLAGAFFGTGAKADALAVAMMESWIAFAKNGDPSNATTGPWPRYDAQSRETMIFGDGAPHVADAPNETRREAWAEIPEASIGP